MAKRDMFGGYVKPAPRAKPISATEVTAWALVIGTILVGSMYSVLGVSFIHRLLG